MIFFLDVCKSFFPQAASCCLRNHKHFSKDKCPCVEGRLRRRRFRLGVGFGFAASFTIGFDARMSKIPCFRTCSLLSIHTSPLPTPQTTLHCSKDFPSTLGRSACTHDDAKLALCQPWPWKQNYDPRSQTSRPLTKLLLFSKFCAQGWWIICMPSPLPSLPVWTLYTVLNFTLLQLCSCLLYV